MPAQVRPAAADFRTAMGLLLQAQWRFLCEIAGYDQIFWADAPVALQANAKMGNWQPLYLRFCQRSQLRAKRLPKL